VVVVVVMALQPFVGPWLLFQFRNSILSRQDSLVGGSARHKAVAYIKDNTNIEHTDMHTSSGIRTHDPSISAGKDSSCFRHATTAMV
jgi:hypothetical protein